MSAYNEDALWWLQDKTLFKLLGKNSSSGTAGVRGSPQSVPAAAGAQASRAALRAQGSAPLTHLCEPG